jgi:hypothetical protein
VTEFEAMRDTASDEEIARRRDEALRRALNTPSQRKHEKAKESNPTKAERSDVPKRGKQGRVGGA